MVAFHLFYLFEHLSVHTCSFYLFTSTYIELQLVRSDGFSAEKFLLVKFMKEKKKKKMR